MRRRTLLAVGAAVGSGAGCLRLTDAQSRDQSATPPDTAAENPATPSATPTETLTETPTRSRPTKLVADDGDRNDRFGSAVGLSGDASTAIIGAPNDDDPNGDFAGSAYVFTRSGGSWRQQAKLAAYDGEARDAFGDSVAISGDGNTVIVGAPDATLETRAGEEPVGAAYVFTRSGGSWEIAKKLDAGEPRDVNGTFGYPVELSGDGSTAIIGDIADDNSDRVPVGAAHVFTRSGGSWQQQAKLRGDGGDRDNRFGTSIGVSNDGSTVVIGDSGDEDPNGWFAGSAYVFTRSGGSWQQQAKLAADDGDRYDNFGSSVAVSGGGDTAIIGAVTDEDPNGEDAGSAYAFTRSGETWKQQAKLAADNGNRESRFGSSADVSSDGTTAFIGSSSVYVFTRSGRDWQQQPSEFTVDDGDSRSVITGPFGVSGDGETIIIGQSGDAYPNGEDAGSAYVFE